jgi:hypothetical protein
MHSEALESRDDDAAVVCPQCNNVHLRAHRVLHHLPCAYVGPEYDFKTDQVEGIICPKCLQPFGSGTKLWEEVGRSFRCDACGYEDV